MRTFVLRLWTSALADGGRSALCGVVEEVESGERSIFRDAQELLERLSPDPGMTGGEHDDEPVSATQGATAR
jgi:hypothetical protein